MRGRPLRVCLTGSECTGKTTLARTLAARLGAPWVRESSRDYAETKGGPLDATDVEPIARLHAVLADEAARTAGEVLVLDTDLLSTVVYARHYYGSCPANVERAARERLADLYLLHHPDVPWIPDPARDRGHLRPVMHALFAAALEEFDARVADVKGPWDERERRALAAIEELRAARGH